MRFDELGISGEVLESIKEMGFEEPTEIQAKAIPPAIAGKDVIAGSATGSGKTLVFGAAIIDSITKGQGIQGLILTPTRELAEQIFEMLKTYSKHRQLSVCTIYGGVAYNPQFHALETADIVVGTPGRILDHLQRQTIDLSKVKHLVLDEADRMLDMGFLDDVNRIMSQCPKEKQTLLFSATIHPEIVELSKRFMKDPVRVSVDCYVDPSKLEQVYYDVQRNLKFSLLVHLLKKESKGLVMVFCNSRMSTDFVANGLKQVGIDAIGIHGGLTQAKRSDVMEKFNSKKAFVLVCTDVAARGLDIHGVSHVYNYDIPNDPKQYMHRIGRTARAGASGIAVNLLCDTDHDNFTRVLAEYDVNIKKVERPYIEKLDFNMSRGRRPSRRPYEHRRGHRQ